MTLFHPLWPDTITEQALKRGETALKTAKALNTNEREKNYIQAADLEDSMDKNPVTPGAVLPARELLGDMHMLICDYANALIAYRKSLELNPKRLNSQAGLKAAAKLARH